MADVKLRQIRSANGSSAKQRGTLASLKLGRIGASSTMADTPQLRGALSRVAHLVEIDGVAPTRGVTAAPAPAGAKGDGAEKASAAKGSGGDS